LLIEATGRSRKRKAARQQLPPAFLFDFPHILWQNEEVKLANILNNNHEKLLSHNARQAKYLR